MVRSSEPEVGPPPTVLVGRWSVADIDRSELIDHLTSLAEQDGGALAIDLHVSGLRPMQSTLSAALPMVDLAYADGWSVVALARLSGASAVQRATTTYLAPDLLDALTMRWKRPVNVAMVGGPPGLALRAGASLERNHNVRVVHVDHGYVDEDLWPERLAELRASQPDIVFVGLGHPLEVVWSARHRDALPPALIMTCGGWFGYLVGEERTAPRWVRTIGMEWAFRLAQDPRRLAGRYLRGVWDLVRVAMQILRRRWRENR